jgi:superfamily II helicase
MAPTEILARQHFSGNEDWLMKWGISADLLVGSLTPRIKEDVRSRLKTGQTDIIFGTHALIQESVQFSHLGFVVVDEQHRFGVEQRKALEEYWSIKRFKSYQYFNQVNNSDFSVIKEIISKNIFNTLSIRQEDYCIIKDNDNII